MKKPQQPSTDPSLRAENAELRARLEEAEEMLRAIRAGEVNALVVEGDAGPQLITLQGIEAEQNRFCGAMLAQVCDAVIAVDTEERVTFLNAAAECLYRVSVDDVLGRKIGEIFTPHWPSPEAEAGMRTTMSERGSWRGELIHRRPDGSEEHVETSASTLRDSDGAITGLVASIRDNAERHQAEAELRRNTALFFKIIEQAPGGVYVVDAQFRVAQMNAESLPFFASAAPLIGRDFDEALEIVWGPEVGPQIASIFRHTLATGERYISPRFSEQRHDLGVEQSFEWETQRITLPDGQNGVVCYFQDVTARERAEEARRVSEEARRVSEERYRSLVTASSAVVYRMSADWSEMHQLGGQNFVVDTTAPSVNWIEEYLYPEEQPQVLAVIREAIRTKSHFEMEHRVRRVDGSVGWTSTHAIPLLNAEGEITEWFGAASDITERKKAQEAVARLAAIVESSHDALFSENLDGIVASLNFGAEQIFGYRADEMVGTSILRMIPETSQAEEYELQRRIVAGGRGGTFETIRQAKDGREFNASITVSPLKDGAGKIIGTSRVVRDITERKRAADALQANEERMRLATEATEVGIWEWNVLTGAIHWDAQMFHLYGVAPTADGLVSYVTWSSALLPGDLAREEEARQDTLQRCGQSTREFRILRADDGKCRWIQAIETVRPNAEGKAEWVIGTNLDVTEQRNAERAIREEGQRKDEFLAMLGHELRNPLNAICHAVQIYGEAPDDAEACQWAAKVIDRQSQQLSRMVDDLLDVARINRGRIELRVEALDLGRVLEQATAAIRPIFAQRRQTFTSDIGSPLRVTGDAARLEQVFGNLLTNAAKYTPENGRISLRAQNDDGEIVVTITDNGVGIANDLLPHVFDLFRQADSTLDRALGGLGIGLNVVKSLVEMHHGRVDIGSAGANAGTTVTVRLPLLLALPGVEQPPLPPALGAEPLPSRRVLIVDDHEDAAQGLAFLLQMRGCEVRCAHTGPDGAALAREFHPEVLLLDLGLPGFDGYELARLLRADASFSSALFVAISGYAHESDRQRCLAAGFDHHLAKPLDIPRLLETLRAEADRRAAVHQES